MVGWAEASQGAPVSNEAGKPNSAQPTTRKIGLFGGGKINLSFEAALWLRSPPKLTRYFSSHSIQPPITVLASQCKNLADASLDSAC
jgi:hypothetical protein